MFAIASMPAETWEGTKSGRFKTIDTHSLIPRNAISAYDLPI